MKKLFLLFIAAIIVLCACNSNDNVGESSTDGDAVLSEASLDVSDSASGESQADISKGNNSVVIESSLPETSSPETSDNPGDETSDTSSPSNDKDTQAELIICGVPVTDRNMYDVLGDGTVSVRYIESEFTYEVTLRDANLNASAGLTPETVSESYMGIYCSTNLTVYLSGENTIYIPNPNADYFHCFGINCDGDNLTIAGSGTLDIKSEQNMNCFELYGIAAYESKITCDISIDLDGAENNCGICIEKLKILHSDISVSAVTEGDGCAAQALAAYSVTLESSSLDAFGDSNGAIEDYYSFPRDPYSNRYMSAPYIALDTESEMVMRGSSAVCFNNHFYLGVSDFIPDIYCGNSKASAKSAKAVYNSVPDAFGKSYIRLVGKSKDNYYLFIGSKAVTEKNADDVFGDGTISFDYSEKTLYLKNADITGKTAANADGKVDYAIYSGIPLNICLSGENSVKTEGSDTSVHSSIAIYAPKLDFFGDGSLYVQSGVTTDDGTPYSTAIYSKTTYKQHGGSITAISADANNSGYGESNAIRAFGDITVFSGYLYCESGKAAWNDPIDPSTYSDMNVLIYPDNAEYEEGETANGNKYVKITTKREILSGTPEIYNRMEEIEKAFDAEMENAYTTRDMVDTTLKYADMYGEIAEEYYLKLLSVGNDENWYFDDNRYTPEEFYEYVRELKANWDEYFENEMEIYSNIIAVQYQGGTITSVIYASRYYKLKYDWAKELVNIYYG